MRWHQLRQTDHSGKFKGGEQIFNIGIFKIGMGLTAPPTTGAPTTTTTTRRGEDDDAFESRSRQTRKRKRDATGHFAARKKAGGRVPKQAVPNEREWAEFRAKRGAPLHDLLDLFADSGDEEE